MIINSFDNKSSAKINPTPKDNVHANGFYKHMGAELVDERTITIGEQELLENIYYKKI